MGQITPSVALVCSLVLHAGLVIALRQAPPTSTDRQPASPLVSDDAPFVLLPTAPPEPPRPEPLRTEPVTSPPAQASADAPVPPMIATRPLPTPAVPPTTPPEPPSPLRPVELGQADGTPGSTDWIASNATGQHSAMLATDQAGLTRTPGRSPTPGAMSPPAPPATPTAEEPTPQVSPDRAAGSRPQPSDEPAQVTPPQRASAGPEVDSRASTDPNAVTPLAQSVPEARPEPPQAAITPTATVSTATRPIAAEPRESPSTSVTDRKPRPGVGQDPSITTDAPAMPTNSDSTTIGPESVRSAGQQQTTAPLPGPGPKPPEPAPEPKTAPPPSAMVPPSAQVSPAAPESRPAATVGTEPAPGLSTPTPDLILTQTLTSTPRPPQRAAGQAAPPTPNTPRPSPAPSNTPAAPSSSQGNAGAQSDREVDPTSSVRRGEFRNGRVNVGKGLELRPLQRPEFSLIARDLASPSSPIVEIHIRKSGQIADVKVIRSSGYPVEIDEPIRNAIFFWRASGDELASLSDDPDARFVVRLTFNLR